MRTPKWFLKKTMVAYMFLPLSFLYFFISKIVYFFRLIQQKKSKRPIICVGNILAGGVGKTPVVRQIAEKLKAPVVMRGYKAKDGNIGDEAKMLKRAGIEVHVGNRKKSINILNKKNIKTPIIFDDGFQNPGVYKNISILVFDEIIGVGNNFVLPAGPLREPVSAIKRSDAIIVIKRSNNNSQNVFINKIKKYKKPIFYAKNETLDVSNGKYIAFAGIGYPEKFFNGLPKKPIKTISFPDHYEYTKKDLNNLFNIAKSEKSELITTEKDWVRLPKFAQKRIKYAPLKTVIEPVFWNWLKGEIK